MSKQRSNNMAGGGVEQRQSGFVFFPFFSTPSIVTMREEEKKMADTQTGLLDLMLYSFNLYNLCRACEFSFHFLSLGPLTSSRCSEAGHFFPSFFFLFFLLLRLAECGHELGREGSQNKPAYTALINGRHNNFYDVGPATPAVPQILLTCERVLRRRDAICQRDWPRIGVEGL
ncbi:hypothetical protein LZ31DRAFT_240813 [Colletotrichum somersetense]|nr:hypothetical protein LZ31DRAFT_240813 [Colletotrichum somersetense]